MKEFSKEQKANNAVQQQRAPVKNMATSKHVVRVKKVVPTETAGSFDFGRLQSMKNPDDRKKYIREAVAQAHYISLSDMLMNTERGGRAALEAVMIDSKTAVSRGQSPRTWRIMVVVNKDGSKPRPGDKIDWVRQEYNRLDYGYGKKIGVDTAERMRRRGEGYLLKDEAEVTLDSECCFDCAYSDAAYLLSQFGIYYLTFEPNGPRENDSPITEKKRVSRIGTHNWRFVEVPPDWENKIISRQEEEAQ